MKAKFEEQGANDVAFAIAFFAQLAGLCAWIGYAAVTGQYNFVDRAADVGEAAVSGEVVALLQGRHHRMFAGGGSRVEDQAVLAVCITFASLVLAFGWAVLWMLLLQICPARIVEASLVSLPVMSLVMVWACCAQGNMFGGCIFAAITAFGAWYVWSVWDRVDFTAKLFKSVSTIYSKANGVFIVALAVVASQTAWTLIWLLAIVPLYVAEHSSGLSGLAWVAFLLSFFWTSQVISNVLHVTCSGVVARYYYNEQVEDAVSKSAKQALTTNFGSICFGSLLIALIQTVRALCDSARESARNSGAPVAVRAVCLATVDCVLHVIERLTRIFTTYVFAYIAICAMPFYEAGDRVWHLMQDSDAEPLVNFSMANSVSIFGSLAGAIFNCALTALLAWRVGLETVGVAGAAVLGFIAGFAVMSVVSCIFEAGSTTLFVAFAESPAALSDLDGELMSLFDERATLITACKLQRSPRARPYQD